jgi:hypothetical protein
MFRDINHDSTLNHLLLLGAGGKNQRTDPLAMATRPLTIEGAMAMQVGLVDNEWF